MMVRGPLEIFIIIIEGLEIISGEYVVHRTDRGLCIRAD
jgi:hypothetical protein